MKAKSPPPSSPLQPLPAPALWSALTTAQPQQLARLFAHMLCQMRLTPRAQEVHNGSTATKITSLQQAKQAYIYICRSSLEQVPKHQERTDL